MQIYLLPCACGAAAGEAYCKENFPLRYRRTQGYASAESRALSICAGILLREVLGCREEELRYTRNGKPCLASGPHFSLSHSGGYAALAVGEGETGLDLEAVTRPRPGVMKRVFTPEEEAFAWDDPKKFTQIWTLKEAFSKLTGDGLAFPFRTLPVLPALSGEPVIRQDIPYFAHTALLFDEGYALSAFSTVKEPVTIREWKR